MSDQPCPHPTLTFWGPRDCSMKPASPTTMVGSWGTRGPVKSSKVAFLQGHLSSSVSASPPHTQTHPFPQVFAPQRQPPHTGFHLKTLQHLYLHYNSPFPASSNHLLPSQGC